MNNPGLPETELPELPAEPTALPEREAAELVAAAEPVAEEPAAPLEEAPAPLPVPGLDDSSLYIHRELSHREPCRGQALRPWSTRQASIGHGGIRYGNSGTGLLLLLPSHTQE